MKLHTINKKNLLFTYYISRILIDDGYSTFSGTTPVYHYYLKDHLGNNRMVVRADGTVEQTNSYYPFGGWFFGINYTDAQPYKYNGKELDHRSFICLKVNVIGSKDLSCLRRPLTERAQRYDYGARHYDPYLARWMCMDPKAEKYYSISPYAYCGNNPVNAIDPDGMKVLERNKIIIYISNGQLKVSSQASPYTTKLYIGMMKTPTGRRILKQMVNSPTSIHLSYSDKDTYNNGSPTYAETEQTTKDGKSIKKGKNGKCYSTWARTTFYVKTIEKSTQDKTLSNYGLTMEEALGAEGSHEGAHSSDSQEVDADIRSAQKNENARSEKEFERKPRKTEKDYRDELSKINNNNNE